MLDLTIAELRKLYAAVALADPGPIEENELLSKLYAEMKTKKEAEKTIDVPALTQMLGLPAHEQGAVASWSGEEPADMYRPDGTAKLCWTAEEAAELVRVWHAQYADNIENGR